MVEGKKKFKIVEFSFSFHLFGFYLNCNFSIKFAIKIEYFFHVIKYLYIERESEMYICRFFFHLVCN